MALDRQMRRLTLRDLIFDAEKRSRDLIEKMGKVWIQRATDLRDLSRPSRKRSSFPSLISLKHSIEKMLAIHEETTELLESLTHELDEIQDHARRERVKRGG